MLAVSRALGDHALKAAGVSGLPHQTHVSLDQKHKYMIVACDGNNPFCPAAARRCPPDPDQRPSLLSAPTRAML